MAAERRYPFFSNVGCAYFPCHQGVPQDDFNCLFCYCPLYALGPECGGDFRYTDTGRKDCAPCSLPHRGDAGTALVKAHYAQLAALAARPSEDGNAARPDAELGAGADAPEGGRGGQGPGQSGEGEDAAAGAEGAATNTPEEGDAR